MQGAYIRAVNLAEWKREPRIRILLLSFVETLGRCISKHVLDPHHLGFFALRHLDLDHIEAPRQVAAAKPAQPFVRAACDQRPLLAVHRRETSDLSVFPAGLHLDEKQLPALPGDDVHLPSPPALEIPGEHLGVARPQPVGGDVLAVVTRPLPRAAGSRPLPVGRVEIPAETTDDDGYKAHVF